MATVLLAKVFATDNDGLKLVLVLLRRAPPDLWFLRLDANGREVSVTRPNPPKQKRSLCALPVSAFYLFGSSGILVGGSVLERF